MAGRSTSFAPAWNALAVTPSDSVFLSKGTCRFLFVGGAGTVTVLTAAGDTVLFTGVTAGTQLQIQCQRVNSTGTTATNIVAMY